jgi:hypothetical protein
MYCSYLLLLRVLLLAPKTNGKCLKSLVEHGVDDVSITTLIYWL